MHLVFRIFWMRNSLQGFPRSVFIAVPPSGLDGPWFHYLLCCPVGDLRRSKNKLDQKHGFDQEEETDGPIIWNFIFIGMRGGFFGIAIWSRAGSTKEYYTASGGVSPFANGMATAADWMSAATFISMAGGIAAAGYGASKFLMGWTGGFVLLTTLMVPYLRKFGKATVPDFIGDRSIPMVPLGSCDLCDFHLHDLHHGPNARVGIVFSRLFDIEIWMGF